MKIFLTNNCLLSTYWVPGPLLGRGSDQDSLSPVGETDLFPVMNPDRQSWEGNLETDPAWGSRGFGRKGYWS